MKQKLVVGMVLCALLVGLSAAPVWAAPPATNQIIHIVRWGENLTYIAARYGTTVEAIMSLNGITNPNRIYAGQRLLIPGAVSPPAPAPTCGQVYTVQPGDTLTGIAFRWGISVNALVQANGIVNPNSIYYGQILRIPCGGYTPPPPPPPAPPPQPSAGWWYIVHPGDTLAKLSWRFGVRIWIIVRANNIANPNLICVGQRLFIPRPSTPVPLPTPTPTPAPAEPGCEHLLSPVRGATLSGHVQITGTADVDEFWYYKLEFRYEGLDNWHYITGQNTPVENGVLGTWDTTILPDGAYHLRLVVVDLTGNYPPPCEIPVHVDNP
jgi:LysM repeat protein